MGRSAGVRRLGEELRSIATLRALQLGDLLCAVPAWRALRLAYPRAHIVLIGLPWAREFVSRFHRYLDEFVELPGYPGLPERQPDIASLPAFFERLQARRFDCLLQMQGSGHYANEIVSLGGASQMAGFYRPPDYCPDPNLFMPYPEGIAEVRRHLALMEFLGVPTAGEALEFPLTKQDETEWHGFPESALLVNTSYVCIHPGGRRPQNRWSPEQFGRVADRLAAEGVTVVLTGTGSEQALGEAVERSMQSHPVNLIGRTTLGSLGMLVKHARMVVSNDTGISHVTAALEVPSVIICINSDPGRWSPLNRRLHRVLVGHDTTAASVIAEIEPCLRRQTHADPQRTRKASALARRGDRRTRRLRVLTWHVHGNYLYYLSQTPHEFLVPVGRPSPGYAGCPPGFPWPANIQEVAVSELPGTDFDCILFQSATAYMADQYELLTPEQRALPKIYLEHDPPQEHPTDTFHPVDDPDMLLIHVTHFNRLMWNSRRTPTRVIEHGVLVPPHLTYSGEWEKGLVVVNHLERRGRRLGADIFEQIRHRLPLDLAGMDSAGAGGLGDVGHDRLPELMCRYRFVFHPIRYTSLGLALCEAMSLGVPPVALATTEAPTVIQHNVSGYLDTSVDGLVRCMERLLTDLDEARRLGAGARGVARTRFAIDRFTRDWDQTLTEFVRHRTSRAQASVTWTPAHQTEAFS